MNPYHLDIVTLCNRLNTNQSTGLTHNQVTDKSKIYGSNTCNKQKKDSLLLIFLMQFTDTLTVILLLAASLIFCVGNILDASIISGILLFNAILGTLQERRTAIILHELESFNIQESIVIRDGITQIIGHSDLVPGDIILLAAGEIIPADARIISSNNLMVDESMLTGESVPVFKNSTLLSDQDLMIMDQANILFAGTYITSGTVRAVVFGTGMNTEKGKIYHTIDTIKTHTPLQQELHRLTYFILIFVIILCSSFFIAGLISGRPILDLLVMLTALFICVVPEGLPVVMTVILVGGAYKMAKKNVLVKNLKSMETLGRVDMIITDKTGTLTRNEMMVGKVFVDNKILSVSGTGYFKQGVVENQNDHAASLQAIAQASVLINNSVITFHKETNTFKIKGDPTQAAAFIFAQKIDNNIDEVCKSYSIEYTIPFDAQLKYQAVFVKKEEEQRAYILGAPEVILARSNNNDLQVVTILQKFLAQGYRVLAVAEKRYTTINPETLETYQDQITSDLQFLGLLAIIDEPREDVSEVMNQLQSAGIQVIIATGDHRETALHVGKKMGIVESNAQIITGQDFAKMSNEQAVLLLRKNFICARFSPHDKLRLVQIFHEQHKIVAMTGDGINDIPALMASNVSIAMGSASTDLVKKHSDIVLLKDSFKNIIEIIKEGRSIFYRLRRTILYFLTSNTGEVLIVLFALLLQVPLPLLPAQILWLNLIADGFLDASLAAEPSDASTLLKPKMYMQSTIFDIGIIIKTVYLALPMSICGMAVFLHYYQTDIVLARTLTLVTLTMFQWFNALNCRDESKSVFQIGLFSNRWFVLASIAIFILQYMVVYLSFMQYIFTTVSLHFYHWIYAVAIASSIFIVEEIRKFFVQKFFTSSN